MSRESNITFDDGWHRYEAKTFEIAVYDEDGVTPLDVSGVTLQWRLLKHGASLKLKTSTAGEITVGGDDNEVAQVAFLVADYTSAIVAGSYRYELWDRTNDRLLAYGTALLQAGSAE